MQALKKLRNQHRGAEQHRAQDELKAHRGAEIAILQQLQIDNRIGVPPLPPHEKRQRDDSQGEGQGDITVPEPVLFLAFVEDKLQAAHADRHQAEAHSVDRIGFGSFLHQVGWIFHHPVAEQQRNDADGQVDKEDPVPVEVIGDPAAQGGSDRGRGHDCHPIQGESLSALFHRKRIRKNRLLAGGQPTAAQPLQDARQNQ